MIATAAATTVMMATAPNAACSRTLMPNLACGEIFSLMETTPRFPHQPLSAHSRESGNPEILLLTLGPRFRGDERKRVSPALRRQLLDIRIIFSIGLNVPSS